MQYVLLTATSMSTLVSVIAVFVNKGLEAMATATAEAENDLVIKWCPVCREVVIALVPVGWAWAWYWEALCSDCTMRRHARRQRAGDGDEC